jgi:hypothetical protein
MTQFTVVPCPCNTGIQHKQLAKGGEVIPSYSFASVMAATCVLDGLIRVGAISPSDRETALEAIKAAGMPEEQPNKEEGTVMVAANLVSFISSVSFEMFLSKVVAGFSLTAGQEAEVRARVAMRTEDEKIADGVWYYAPYELSPSWVRIMAKYVEPTLLDPILEGVRAVQTAAASSKLMVIHV